MSDFLRISSKIEKARTLDFGDILSRSLELFKKGWLQGFLLMLIVFITMIPFIIFIYVPIYQSLIEQVGNSDYDPNSVANSLFTQDAFRYKILGLTFVVSFLSTMLVAGFYRMLKKIDFSENHSFLDLFYFFKAKYMGRVFAIAAFTLLISLVNYGLEKYLPSSMASLLSVLLSVLSSVYTTLFVVFFAFNPDLEGAEIYSLAFNLGTKKWLLIFGLLLVTGVIGFLGFIACGFGVMFTISIVYFSPYLVYKDVVGFNHLSDIDKIGVNEN